ncbi:hypothetical protein ID866_12465 [Astraeus odoratus]|nr:hypothetical protein ID866_12465 [Astraeus odoratus]
MPLSFPPSTLCPRNPGSPSDDDPGNDDNENPFDDDNSNDNDNDNDDGKSGSSSSQTKVREPNTFDGTDPKKLHTFLVQCELNFQDCPSAFKKDRAKVVFAQSYLKGMALEWFKPDLLSSGNPGSHPLWMDDWTEFIIELQSTFSPHNPVTDTENQLNHLQMKEIRGYGNGTLCHQFYSGLPDHIKDEEVDACYWERKEEVQHTNKSSGTSNFPANKPGSSASNSSKSKPTSSSNANSSSGNANSSLSNKSKSSNGGNKLSNTTSSNPNLTGKLGKDGKLTPEEKK